MEKLFIVTYDKDTTIKQTKKVLAYYRHLIFFFFLFLAIPHGLPDLSSLTRDWTHTLSSEIMES